MPTDPPDALPLFIDGASHSSFRQNLDPLTLGPFSQPASDPSIIADIDDSTAIDRVRALLSTDFTDSRPAWLLLMARLLTDARNGVRTSITSSSLARFRDLSPAEQSSLDSLRLALDGLDVFFSDVQDDPEDWVTCMGCVQTFHVPASKDEWSVNLTACAGMVEEARAAIVKEEVDKARTLIEAWVAGQRVAATDAAINNLVSNNPTSFAEQLIADERVTEWSRRILEAMRQHLDNTLVDRATHLPQSILDKLAAERQAKLDRAEEDACEDAKRLYHAELTRLQNEEYERAHQEFAAWRDTVCAPEFQAKEEAFRVEKLRELDAAKHAMTIEAEEAKETARLAIARSVTTPAKPAEVRRAGRQKRRVDPTKTSRSLSRAASPSPSPSTRATDKTPTKADFALGKQVLDSEQPTDESVGDRSEMSPVPRMGQTTKDSMWAPTDVPMVQDTALAQVPSESNIRGPAVEQAVAPVHPAPVDTVSLPVPTKMACDDARAPVPQVQTTYASCTLANSGQSATLSTVAPPPSDMEAMLLRIVQAAVAPVQAAVTDVATRLTEIEKDREWWPGKDDESDFDRRDALASDQYSIAKSNPPADRHGAPWGQTEDEFPVFTRLTSAPPDEDADMSDNDRVKEEDEFAAALSGNRGQLEPSYEVHPFFYNMAHQLFDDVHIRESTSGGMVTIQNCADDCATLWDEFALAVSARRDVLPPHEPLHKPFYVFCRNRIGEQLLLRKVSIGLLGGTKWQPNIPPPVATLGDRASAPIDVPSSSEPMTSPSPALEPGWHVAGKKGKGKSSWAAVAAAAPTPSSERHKLLPPSRDQALTGFITRPQLESLSKQALVSLFNTRFPTGPRIPQRATKEVAVTTFLLRLQEPQTRETRPTPPPKAISKTEFTLSLDPKAPAPQGQRGDAASLVRQVQQLVKASGSNVKAELIGGRWSSQASRNFVLVFNGNPTYESVLSLQHILVRVFGSAYSLTPARGYTQVILNSVPTMRDTPSSPLPSAQTLRDELFRNEVCRGVLILGDPYWLTARLEGARHGSISFAFLDEDGTKLQRILRNPPYMFGNRTTKPRKYISRPALSECTRCLKLGHTVQRCSAHPSAIVCPICGSGHKEEEHAAKCPNVAKHIGVDCTCAPVCINCIRAKKPSAKGHRAVDASCPLRANFRSVYPQARTSSGGASASPAAARIDDQ